MQGEAITKTIYFLSMLWGLSSIGDKKKYKNTEESQHFSFPLSVRELQKHSSQRYMKTRRHFVILAYIVWNKMKKKKKNNQIYLFTFFELKISTNTYTLVTALRNSKRSKWYQLCPLWEGIYYMLQIDIITIVILEKTHKILTFSHLCQKFTFKIAPSPLASKLATDALWFYVFN